MESEEELRAATRAIERAEAAPWTDYPPTPWWYPAGTGVWAAALVLVIGQAGKHPALAGFGLAGLIIVELVFVVWYRRYRGAMPSGAPPTEFRRPIALLVTGLLATAGLVWLLSAPAGPLLAALLSGALVATLITWYERAYAAAAAAARARLS